MNKPKPVTLNGVLIIGHVNAAKLLGVSPVTIHAAIKHGHKYKGFVVEATTLAWLDV